MVTTKTKHHSAVVYEFAPIAQAEDVETTIEAELALLRSALETCSRTMAQCASELYQIERRLQMIQQTQARLQQLERRQATASELSERERQVLRLVACGMSNEEIAARLVIAEGTVKNHVTAILGKLNVKNRWEAALRARAVGLI